MEFSISDDRNDSSDLICAASRFDEDFKFVDAEIITESEALLSAIRDENVEQASQQVTTGSHLSGFNELFQQENLVCYSE